MPTRHAGCLLVLVVLAFCSGGSVLAAEEAIRIEAWRDADAVVVHARARLEAPLQLAWDVLTDYENYATFIPDMKSSRILARSGNHAIVEQKGEAGFFLYHFPVEVVFSVTELPGAEVSSHAISGTFKEMTGNYVLAGENGNLHLLYTGRMVPEFRLPPLVGLPAVRSAVRRQFGALVHEIRKRALADTLPDSALGQ